jgi:hypothetical protein
MKPFSFIITGLLALIFSASLKSQNYGYSWPLPDKWVKEIIPFPLKFAHELKYPGVEEIHFLPGWRGDTLQDQLWSYIFVWKLDTVLIPDTGRMKNDLVAYFNGLTRWVLKNSKSRVKYQPVSAISVNICSDGRQCFSGKITFLDVFFTFRPITLNVKILSKNIPDSDRTLMFFLLSPMPFNHEIWKTLEDHRSDFILDPE